MAHGAQRAHASGAPLVVVVQDDPDVRQAAAELARNTVPEAQVLAYPTARSARAAFAAGLRPTVLLVEDHPEAAALAAAVRGEAEAAVVVLCPELAAAGPRWKDLPATLLPKPPEPGRLAAALESACQEAQARSMAGFASQAEEATS